MDKIRRLALYLGLALVGVMLWNAWLKDYPPQSTKPNDTAQQQQKGTSEYTPPSFNSTAPPSIQEKNQAAIPRSESEKSTLIWVKTDVLDIGINLTGGYIEEANLLKYPLSLNTPAIPMQLLSGNPDKLYVAQSNLTNSSNSEILKPIKYTASQSNYELVKGSNLLIVRLIGRTENGLAVTKTFTFKRDAYAIAVDYKIKNTSSKSWSGSVYYQITRRKVPMPTALHSRSYDGPAISSPNEPYEKIPYKKLNKDNLNRTVQGGWIAMQQQYFLSTWVPPQNTINHYYSHVSGFSGDQLENKIFTVGYVGEQMTLMPNGIGISRATFYVGPEIAERLSKLAKGLDLTIDYGWLWPISEVIFWIMNQIYKVVGNWGWSIVLVTLLIKIVFYPLSNKSYKSMSKMRDLQPRLKTIKERYGDDKQAMSKATMELYKKEKVNPMSGCLPMLIQVPVFIALYYVLIESVELRHAPFIFWIRDLSVKDPYYVLPILMGLSMLLQQKLSPPPPDPTQAKMMMLLPVVFTIFFISFPAGLVLYWLTNNVLSILQQWYIMRSYKPALAKVKKKNKK